jgi:hypothetical protein
MRRQRRYRRKERPKRKIGTQALAEAMLQERAKRQLAAP